MSTIFESLKKLEQKQNEERLTAAKTLPKSLPGNVVKATPSFPKKLFLSWFIVLTVFLIGLTFFTHLRYQGLSAIVFSQKVTFDAQVDRLAKQIDEINGKIKSMDQNHQMMSTQIDHFSKELEKEHDLQSKALEQKAKLVDQKMNQLAQRINVLEEEEQKNAAPPLERHTSIDR